MTPVTAEEFAKILHGFPFLESVPILAVACSGGADSLALTLLLHAWAQSRGKKVIALTVDHGLRSASAQEATQVHQWLSQRQIAHEVLLWQGEKPKTRIQETARHMRYHLLSEWCQKQGVSVLLTAHHAQDQIETFLMRLAKGSGLQGLCVMRPLADRLSVTLVRPLLTIPPQRLRATLDSLQQSFIDDPSNENRDFERVRWRQAWQDLTRHGLTSEAILTTIERLQESQNLITEQLSALATQFLTLSPHGYLVIDWKSVQALSVEMTELFLSHVLWLLSDQGWRPKHQAIKILCAELRKGPRRIFTLGGAILQVKGQNLFIFRELRAAPRSCSFAEGTHTLWWDGRFMLNIEVPQGETITLKPLGLPKGLSTVCDKKIPSRALLTMPSFWRGEELFFFPSQDTERQDGCCIRVRSLWRSRNMMV